MLLDHISDYLYLAPLVMLTIILTSHLGLFLFAYIVIKPPY
jgi:hypothetical protein